MGLHRIGTLGHIVSSSNIFYEQDTGMSFKLVHKVLVYIEYSTLLNTAKNVELNKNMSLSFLKKQEAFASLFCKTIRKNKKMYHAPRI